MHEHAFHFPVAGRIDAQRAAADGLALATRDEEADAGRAQRVDVEDVVAFRGVERLEIGVERGQEPHHVVLARAFEPDGGPQSPLPRYHGRSFRPEAGFFDIRSRKVCFLFCILVPGAICFPLAASAEDRSWIESSDRNSAIVIEMQGAFHPEFASGLGIDRFDTAVLDLNPENAKRYDDAAGRVLELLSAKRKTESDPKVRRDLDILIDAVESRRRTSALEYRLLIPYFDLPRHIFQGLQVLLDARNDESRRRNACDATPGWSRGRRRSPTSRAHAQVSASGLRSSSGPTKDRCARTSITPNATSRGLPSCFARAGCATGRRRTPGSRRNCATTQNG